MVEIIQKLLDQKKFCEQLDLARGVLSLGSRWLQLQFEFVGLFMFAIRLNIYQTRWFYEGFI